MRIKGLPALFAKAGESRPRLPEGESGRHLLPLNYYKHMYFLFFASIRILFSSNRSNSRPIPLRPLLAAIRADRLGVSALSDDRAENNPAVRDDHDRDDGAAESPYMLIQGSACLTNR